MDNSFSSRLPWPGMPNGMPPQTYTGSMLSNLNPTITPNQMLQTRGPPVSMMNGYGGVQPPASTPSSMGGVFPMWDMDVSSQMFMQTMNFERMLKQQGMVDSVASSSSMRTEDVLSRSVNSDANRDLIEQQQAMEQARLLQRFKELRQWQQQQQEMLMSQQQQQLSLLRKEQERMQGMITKQRDNQWGGGHPNLYSNTETPPRRSVPPGMDMSQFLPSSVVNESKGSLPKPVMYVQPKEDDDEIKTNPDLFSDTNSNRGSQAGVEEGMFPIPDSASEASTDVGIHQLRQGEVKSMSQLRQRLNPHELDAPKKLHRSFAELEADEEFLNMSSQSPTLLEMQLDKHQESRAEPIHEEDENSEESGDDDDIAHNDEDEVGNSDSDAEEDDGEEETDSDEDQENTQIEVREDVNVDDIPIKPGIEGGKTFEQLLEEQLKAEEQRLKQTQTSNDSPSQPKRSFLKKGEGTSRFQSKPGQRPSRPKKPTTAGSLQGQGSTRAASQKTGSSSEVKDKQGVKGTTKPPVHSKAGKQSSQNKVQAVKQQKPDQKEKKSSTKETEKSATSTQKSTQSDVHPAGGKQGLARKDPFPDDASFVASLTQRQKESEADMADLDEFEILEQFADNMSFCSNSSIVTKGLRGLQNDRILTGVTPKSQEIGRPTSPRAVFIKKLELEKQAKHKEQLEQMANVRKIAPSAGSDQKSNKAKKPYHVKSINADTKTQGNREKAESQHKIVRKESRKHTSHDEEDDDEYESVSDSSDDSESDDSDSDDADDIGNDKGSKNHLGDKNQTSRFSISGHSEKLSHDKGHDSSHFKNVSVCSTDKKLERALSYTGFTEASSLTSESERDIDSEEDERNKLDSDDNDEFDFSGGKDDSENKSPSKPLTRKVAKRDESNKFPFQTLPSDSELMQTSLNLSVSAFVPKVKSPIIISKEKVSLESNLRHEVLKKEELKFSYHSDSDSAGNKNDSFSDSEYDGLSKEQHEARKSFGEKKTLQFDDDEEWGELTPKILKSRRRKESEGDHDKTLVEENESDSSQKAHSKHQTSEKEGEDTPPTSKLVSKLFPSLKPPQKKQEEQNLEKIQAASNAGDGVQSKILRDKLIELEREIEKFRNENKHLTSLRSEREQGLTLLKREIAEFEKEKAEELKRIEEFRNEEMKKLKHEKKMFEKYQKAARAGPDKKEREEIESLRSQLSDLQEEMKRKESRWTANNARLRDRIDQLEQENEELKGEIKMLEKKRLEWMQRDQKNIPRSRSREAVQRSSTPTEDLDQLANGQVEAAYNGTDLSASTRSNASLKQSQHQPKVNIRSSFPPPNKPSTHTHAQSTHSQPAQNKISNINQSAKTNMTQSGVKVNQSKKNVSHNAKPGHSVHGHGSKGKTAGKAASVVSGKSSNSSEGKNVLRNSLTEDLPRRELGTIAEPQDVSMFSNPDGDGGDYTSPQNMPRKFARPGVDRSVIDKGDNDQYDEVQHSDGKVERTYKNGAREILFSNGTRKEISADGKSIIVSFFNGDIKQIMPDQRVIYYYAENQTTHTNYPDGLEILQFPNQQTEKLYPDGTKEITFPDQTIKYIFPNGSEESIFQDGTVIRLEKNGDKTMEFPNGQREIHTREYKKREYPDGTVKTVYPDGQQETRYSNGRLRVKDKDGNVIIDRQC